MNINKTTPPRRMSVFSLVMINLIAVDSIRALPISAEYGWALVFYYVLGGLLFMIPSALAAAELSTGWPESGGIYVWVREAMGKPMAFFVAWLLWIYNIVWYPSILALLSSTVLYLFSPALASNKEAIFFLSIGMYALAMFSNLYGMRISSLISNVGSVIGVIFPILLIIGLTALWVVSGKTIATHFAWHKLIPSFSSPSQLAILTGMLFGMVGMEMSAVHAREVKNPQRDYPRALWMSTVIILSTSVLGALGIALIIPQNAINLSSGVIESFGILFKSFGLNFLLPIIALCIVVGGFAGVSAWIIGPSKCMLIAAKDGSVPAFLSKTNKHHVPTRLLWLQAMLFFLLALLFLVFPGFNAAYWLISAMTAELSVLFYIILFAALIILRKNKPEIQRSFSIPGGLLGASLVGGIGVITCVFVFCVGLLPPSQLKIINPHIYEVVLIGGIALFCAVPWLILAWRNRPTTA